MEHRVRVLPPEVLMEQLLGLLDSAEYVPLNISGSRMTPFLVHSRDTVYLSKVTRPLKKGVRPDQVLALVTAVRRREKLLQPGSFWWDFFEKVWIRVIPLRPGIVAAYSALTGAFRKAETAHD